VNTTCCGGCSSEARRLSPRAYREPRTPSTAESRLGRSPGNRSRGEQPGGRGRREPRIRSTPGHVKGWLRPRPPLRGGGVESTGGGSRATADTRGRLGSPGGVPAFLPAGGRMRFAGRPCGRSRPVASDRELGPQPDPLPHGAPRPRPGFPPGGRARPRVAGCVPLAPARPGRCFSKRRS